MTSLLAQAGLFELAIDISKRFSLSMVPVFEALTARLASILREGYERKGGEWEGEEGRERGAERKGGRRGERERGIEEGGRREGGEREGEGERIAYIIPTFNHINSAGVFISQLH